MDVPVDDVVLLRPEHEPVPEDVEHARQVDLMFAGLVAFFRKRDDVAVFERIAWFPDKQNTRIRLDPDVMVVVGRPPGYRTSYKAWMEGQVAPRLIIEVVSRNDSFNDYVDRLARMRAFGVESVLLVSPFTGGSARVELLLPSEDGKGWLTAAVSSSPTEEIHLGWADIWFSGGDVVRVRDESGVWQDTGTTKAMLADAESEIRRAGALVDEAQAAADQAIAETARYRSLLEAAGIDPDAVS